MPRPIAMPPMPPWDDSCCVEGRPMPCPMSMPRGASAEGGAKRGTCVGVGEWWHMLALKPACVYGGGAGCR